MNELIAALEERLALLREKAGQDVEELKAEAIAVRNRVVAELDALLAKL